MKSFATSAMALYIGHRVMGITRTMTKRRAHQCFSSLATTMPRDGQNPSSSTNKETEQVKSSERLTKYIASTGICSRREAEAWIKAGRVQLDGLVVTNVGSLIDISSKTKPLVMVDGVKLVRNRQLLPPRLWIAYKKPRELTADNDLLKGRDLLINRVKRLMNSTQGAGLEIDFSKKENALKPINRLDYNTEGLCLLTNNGIIARIMNSNPEIVIEYRVRVHGLITESKLDGLRRGVFMNNRKQKPMKVTIENKSSTVSWIRIATAETSNRTVYNTLRQLHLDVTRMICIGYGGYKLNSINTATGVVEAKLTPELTKAYLTHQKT